MRLAVSLFLLLNLVVSTAVQAANSEQSLIAMRRTFVQAEQYIKQGREHDFFALADTLKKYPLYPYLQFQWLTQHLEDTESVKLFLNEFIHSRYAPLLHSKWLAYLGKTKQWLLFAGNYQKSKDLELQCYFAQAQYEIGERLAALEAAKEFWLSGKPLPTACNSLIDVFKDSGNLNQQLVWQRFQAALERNNSDLAAQLLPLFLGSERSMAEVWLKLHHHPKYVQDAAQWKKSYPEAGLLFAHAIVRWLANDANAALQVWVAQHHSFTIPEAVVVETEKRLGMQLAFDRDQRAYELLSKYTGNDTSAKEWRVRAALNRQNWQQVLAAITYLTETQKQEDRWRYWQAKALSASGQQSQSLVIFQELAKQRSFYGFLSAEVLKRSINLNHQPVLASEQEINRLQGLDEFQAVKEWLNLDRRSEATRQWWHALAELDQQQLLVAARLAERWNWSSLAIFTVAKANHWDDMELRFPLLFKPQVLTNADRYQLDPALILALIRQESAFDVFAGSSVGAIGLMQLMPATAKQIASDLKLNWTNPYNLLDPDINIRFGSHYFSDILKQWNGHLILATASYNAGSQRVKKWLPKNRSLPADIWLETIPYKETRGYIASVLMYALIYQQRLQRSNLKITDLLQEVKPG